MTVCIVAEKPSAARNFAKALGGMSGSYNGTPYVIVAERGHLFENVDPHEMVAETARDKYKSWDVNNLPWKHTEMSFKRKRRGDVSASDINALKTAIAKADEVVCATDVDPTGEGFLLFSELIDEIGPLPGVKFSRMYHMDESEKEVRKAFENRKPVSNVFRHDEHLMADYRQKFDYLSQQFVRIATAFGNGDIIRTGRLKGAMVRLVGEQILANKAYVKKTEYCSEFVDEAGVKYREKDIRLFADKKDAQKEVDSYHASAIVEDGRRKGHTAPPKYLDLAKLSGILAPKGLKPETMLSVYQKMYEAQVLSYPRSEDDFVSEEQFNELLPLTDTIAAVVGVDAGLLTHRTPRKKSHVKAGGAHGANRPGPKVPGSLSELDAKFGTGAGLIYETLAKSWLAALAEDYEYETVSGHVKDYPSYVGQVQVPLAYGWRQVAGGFTDDDDDAETGKGLGTMGQPQVGEKSNVRPPWPTVKWLTKKLENHSVGTGATRTSTLSAVTKQPKSSKVKALMSETKGKLDLTDTGWQSYWLTVGTHIASLELTENLYAQMAEVAKGADAQKYLDQVASMVLDDIATMKKNAPEMFAQTGLTPRAPSVRREGTFKGKQISYKAEFAGHEITDSEHAKLLAGEEVRLEGLTSKSGNIFGCFVKIVESTYKGRTFFKLEPRFDSNGSESSSDDYVSGEFTGRGKRKGTTVRFKKAWGGHTFTDKEIERLLAGKEITFEAKSSKTGRMYTAKGKLAEQSFKGRKFFGFKPDFSGLHSSMVYNNK